ncbi:MAG: glycosyltransferase family 1 protein [Alphaproteobacteria bacterium HGW-Alphaproteobacteria-2]|nr:MAG: glycosyltransferase family 1 protein [Alphaproteobacteria bacterium HGW-Alphaproteobacteria-2]
MRILVVGSHATGLRNFRGALIEELLSRGHEVVTAAPGLRADGSTRDWLEERGVACQDIPLTRTGLRPDADLRTFFALYRLMRQVRPDVSLCYTVKPVVWGGLAAWCARVPRRVALITGLGYAFTGEARGKRARVRMIVQRLYAIALRRATLVLFQNPDDRADFARWGLLPPDVPVEVVNGSGVDVEAFAPAPLPEGPLRFLLIARLLGDKGIREYVAAAARLRSRWPGAEFHLVGPPDPNPDAIAREEVERWHASGNVIWHGELEDVRPAIAAAHVYVLPSYYREGTPRTALEAMAMGRPVITTDTPGCRETVQEGRSGFLVPARDAETLAAAMERFLDQPDLLVGMGQAARQLAEERYDVRKVNAAILSAMDL